MERIRNLDRYQKGILIVLLVMLVVFAAVYYVTISQEGFLYNEAILVPGEANGSTVYSGKINGTEAAFTVSHNDTVTFRYGEKVYGPYTVKEDPTAIPEGESLSEYMTGFEIRDGEEIFFRGGGFKNGGEDGYWMLYDEDGSFDLNITITAANGTVTDGAGNIIDPMVPSPGTILEMAEDPTLTHKGHWYFWFMGLMVSALTVVSILFADQLFRWQLRYQIRNADLAEPSEWEIASRYIGWTIMVAAVFVCYMMGLQ